MSGQLLRGLAFYYFVMEDRKTMILGKGKKSEVRRDPDKGKCEPQKSRELEGHTPGDRGMCEKRSTTQGSE